MIAKCICLSLLAASACTAAAQDYPVRPVRTIVAYPPGGSTDIIARIIGQKLTDRLGQTVIVDNRGGAAGMIGAELVARATPDGHTLMVVDSPFVVNPFVFARVPYDTLRDFTPIQLVGSSPLLLVVTASSPAKTLQEFITLAKAQPGKITIASAGTGASSHVVAELFKIRAGVNLTHVPFKGLGPALTDVTGGQVDSIFSSIPAALQLVKSGKLRALGICTKKRMGALPDIPTIEEGGVPDFEAAIWYGYQGPAGIPRPVVDKLSAEIARAAELPDVKERFTGMGLEVTLLGPDAFRQYIARELKKWGDVTKAAGIKPE
ncbi:MAG: Bug family tripartite tricarboxylate transporter substrate binding protein [Burkholderiales bacterium]